MTILVYTGTSTTTPISTGHAVATGTGTTVTYPALTMVNTSGSSWVVGMGTHRSTNTTITTAPTGMTHRTGSTVAGTVSGNDTNGGVSSWSLTTESVGGTSSGWGCYTVEILAAPTGGINLVTHAAASGTSTSATTTAVNTTGSTLFVVGATYDTTAVPTISDSASNTWNALTPTNTSSAGAVLNWCANPTTSSSHTFTASGAGTFPALFMLAFSGTTTATPFDVENGSTTATTTLQPGSITPAVNGEVLVTFFGFNGAGVPVSIDSSYIQADSAIDFGSGVHYGGAMAYLIQTTAGASNPTWTRTNSATNAGRIAAFKASSTAPTSVTFITYRPPWRS